MRRYPSGTTPPLISLSSLPSSSNTRSTRSNNSAHTHSGVSDTANGMAMFSNLLPIDHPPNTAHAPYIPSAPNTIMPAVTNLNDPNSASWRGHASNRVVQVGGMYDNRAFHTQTQTFDTKAQGPCLGDNATLMTLPRGKFTDAATLFLSLVVSFGACGLGDAIRSSSTAVGTVPDVIFVCLGCLFAVASGVWRVAVMWRTLGGGDDDAVKHTVVDVASVYLLSIVAFGTIYLLAEVAEGRFNAEMALFPSAEYRLLLRFLDALYVISFVATGVGYPGSGHERPVAMRLVAWICALLSSSIVGKVLIATALSSRFAEMARQRGDRGVHAV